MMEYSQEEIDYIHDILIDLLISCMRSGNIPFEKPEIGDWCIEFSSFKIDHDNCIGRLKKKLGDGNYEIELIGGKIITWSNAEFKKIPDNYLRIKKHFNRREMNNMKQQVIVHYKLGHSYDFEYQYEKDLHCPNCGKNSVWIEASEGDFYCGPNHVCINCHFTFNIPTLRKAGYEDEQVITQLNFIK